MLQCREESVQIQRNKPYKYSIQNAAYGRLYNFPEGVVRKFQSSDLSMRAMSVSDVFEVIVK